MHSRIWEICANPLDCGNMSESDFYEGQLPVADYVSSVPNPKEEVDRLIGYLQGIAVAKPYTDPDGEEVLDDDGNPIYEFTVVNKKAYFEPMFENFKKYINRLVELGNDQEQLFDAFCGDEASFNTPEEYQNCFASTMWKLQEAYDDRFSYYAYLDGYDCEPFDSFMRKMKDGDKFYVSMALDYHM